MCDFRWMNRIASHMFHSSVVVVATATATAATAQCFECMLHLRQFNRRTICVLEHALNQTLKHNKTRCGKWELMPEGKKQINNQCADDWFESLRWISGWDVKTRLQWKMRRTLNVDVCIRVPHNWNLWLDGRENHFSCLNEWWHEIN